MEKTSLLTKIMATIGFLWIVWVVLSLTTGLPGPLGLNR